MVFINAFRSIQAAHSTAQNFVSTRQLRVKSTRQAASSMQRDLCPIHAPFAPKRTIFGCFPDGASS
jgi:hypothetical protein